jgi:hypothetical protein
MKSYIKLYGPPIGEALKTLRKVAIDFPEVCVMDTALEASFGLGSVAGPGGISGAGGQSGLGSVEMVMNYFGGDISEERCDTIISKSGERLGEYDFYYEWFQKPSVAQVEDLISKIDEALAPTGVKYTITTK